MPPTVANEEVGSDLGTPQTPARGLRPPAPPAQELHRDAKNRSAHRATWYRWVLWQTLASQ